MMNWTLTFSFTQWVGDEPKSFDMPLPEMPRVGDEIEVSRYALGQTDVPDGDHEFVQCEVIECRMKLRLSYASGEVLLRPTMDQRHQMMLDQQAGQDVVVTIDGVVATFPPGEPVPVSHLISRSGSYSDPPRVFLYLPEYSSWVVCSGEINLKNGMRFAVLMDGEPDPSST